MIVYENKTFSSNSLYPNRNWTTDNKVVVIDDNSELAKKIKLNSPYFDFVVDNEGQLIDITPTERPPKPILEPNQDDYLLDLDYRLCMIELGL